MNSTLPPKAPPPVLPVKQAPKLPPPVSAPRSAGGGKFALGTIAQRKAQRVILYGTGGVGKSSAACLAARQLGNLAYFDLEDTLPQLESKLQEWEVYPRIKPVQGVEGWADLHEALVADLYKDVGGIVVDTFTRTEEWALAWTLLNTPRESGERVKRLEDYGFGKGYQHLYETFLALFDDLDWHFKQGRSVILLCHEITSTVPNPKGEDYLRWEPRLQHLASGKSSVRHKAKEWADHLLYIGYDVDVNNKGVAIGQGTRTIQTLERPYCMAKSRSLCDPIAYHEGDSSLWEALFPSS